MNTKIMEHLQAIASEFGMHVVTDEQLKKLEQVVSRPKEDYQAGTGGTKRLKDAYGEGKTKTIINRAIREELPGASAVLDARTTLHGASRNPSEWDRLRSELQQVIANLDSAVFEFDNEIRRRYGMAEMQPE